MRRVAKFVRPKEMPRWYRSMLAECQECSGHGMIDPDLHPSTGERAYPCPECGGEGCVARLSIGDKLWRNAQRRDPYTKRGRPGIYERWMKDFSKGVNLE